MGAENIKEQDIMAKTHPSTLKAIDRYKKKYIVNVALQFNTRTEPELTEYVRSLPNKTAYIKGLIRADLERIKEEPKANTESEG